MGPLLEATRPRQWTKNIVVFAAIVFSQHLGEWPALGRTFAAFAIFCALSSAIYLLNDLIDAEQDKLHPLKSKRPIASGRLGKNEALTTAVGLLILATAAGFFLNPPLGVVCVGYAALQLGYMFWFKHQVILDVIAIAIGFVLRAVGGGAAISVEVSHWLLLCTLFLALFLAVCKRRHELLLLRDNSIEHRKTLGHYSESLLDQMVAVVTSSTVISYALYTVAPDTIDRFGSNRLIYTVPFVLFGIFRYLYLVYRREEGGSPEGLLLGDRALLVNIVLFGVAVALLVYWK